MSNGFWDGVLLGLLLSDNDDDDNDDGGNGGGGCFGCLCVLIVLYIALCIIVGILRLIF